MIILVNLTLFGKEIMSPLTLFRMEIESLLTLFGKEVMSPMSL